MIDGGPRPRNPPEPGEELGPRSHAARGDCLDPSFHGGYARSKSPNRRRQANVGGGLTVKILNAALLLTLASSAARHKSW